MTRGEPAVPVGYSEWSRQGQAAAVVGRASHIVTGDAHLLRIGQYRAISIVTAAIFLDLIGRPEPAGSRRSPPVVLQQV